MDPTFFARGIALGFAIAAAVGPISLLTIRRTLAHGQRYGFVSGAGVALADGTYAGIAAFGLTALTNGLVANRAALGLWGGAIMVGLAVRTVTSRPGGVAAEAEPPSLRAAFVSIFGLTLTNPMTILSFASVFAAAGLAGRGGADAALLTAGVFGGSLAWWGLLTAIVARLRSRVTIRGLTWINRISGLALGVFGAVAVITSATAAAGA